MKLERTLFPALVAVVAIQVASGQEITPKWFQHINAVQGVAEADRLPILKKQGQDAALALNGTDLMDAYSQLIRYDATRLLLGIRENGINETDPNITPADQTLAAAYPDRSLIWIDAATGKPSGVAWKESLTAPADIGIDVTAEGKGSQSNANNSWWRVALDEGPEGQRVLYSHFKHLILRYAPKVGGGWETTPTVVYEEPVQGVGDGLSNGDGYISWRFRDFHVRGTGLNTVIYAGGGTWRAGHHPQVLVTTDGLNFKPKGRVDNRDNGGRRNDYALGGLSSFPVEYPNNYGGDPNQKISVVYAGHFPGTGWPARPNRYTSNPNNPYPSPAYNAQPDAALYIRNESAYAGLPAFSWEAADKDGVPIDNAVDGVTRYDGNWNVGMAADASLDYIVSYSSPSWNNQFPDVGGVNVRKPGWLAIHRLDGSIASGNSAFKLEFVESDETYAQDNPDEVGHDYLYDPWIQVVPDTNAAPNLDKADVLVSFGSAGFGVFTVQNVGAALVSSPANQTVAAGSDVTIAANVTGSPNNFQWYRNGVPLQAKPYYQGTVKKVALKIIGVASSDAGTYQLKWNNPISGEGQTAEATLTVTGAASHFAAEQIMPEAGLPVVIPNGSFTSTGENAFTIAGPGLLAFPSATDASQPGDVQEFAYEPITGDFDKRIKLTSLISGPVTDPVDAQASAGFQVRTSTNAISASFGINVANPLGANEVKVTGRGISGQNYTLFSRTYPGVVDTLPNQWLRLQRVGDYFAAYLSTDGANWSLIGQRYQQGADWPGTLLIGAYAFAANYNATEATGGENLTTATFTDYSDTPHNDTVAPSLVSVGTTDKVTVGVKFSEIVNSVSALIPVNYQLSQGNVTSVRSGIGGDSVYLTVAGLTSDTFTVTVLGGITDLAGNAIAANSSANGKVSNWAATDIGLIQDSAARPTPGDDPYRIGQAVAVSSGETETELEIVGGGSNAWNGGDYLTYLNRATPLTGDFDVMVEVSRYDRPANTAGYANGGLMFRETLYLAGQEFTPDGTKVAMVANTTYTENSAPGRSAIPLWRNEPGGGYGNGNAGFTWNNNLIDGIKGYYLDLNAMNAAGERDPESSILSARWLRVVRAGNIFSFYASYNGEVWEKYADDLELPLANSLIFGFSVMNDTGVNPPPGNAYPGNGEPTPELAGNQNASNYSTQRIRIGTNVAPRPPAGPDISVEQGGSGSVIIRFTGTLEGSATLNGQFTPVPNATSPYTVTDPTGMNYYRAVE